MAPDHRVRPRPVRLRQGSGGGLGDRLRARRWSATSTPSAARDFGALLAKLAAGLPVQLATPVTAIDWGSRSGGVEVETGRGAASRPRAVIVTASTNVLAAGKIKFSPSCRAGSSTPSPSSSSAATTTSRSNLPGNPLGCAPTSSCSRNRTARAPHRSSPMSPARRCAWSTSPAASAASSPPRARRR